MDALRTNWLWRNTVIFVFVALILQVVEVKSNAEGDALIYIKNILIDPNHILDSWNLTIGEPCTWPRITCNEDERVVRVDLSYCNFSGQLAPGLAALEEVQSLTFYQNAIEGKIPSDIGSLKKLQSLDLGRNIFSGKIPPSLGNLTSLLYLRLENNRLGGQIPSELGSLVPRVQVVNLTNNVFCGSFPTAFLHNPAVEVLGNPYLWNPCDEDG